jgi:uncharacterized protein YndB with AHSA1/START domain
VSAKTGRVHDRKKRRTPCQIHVSDRVHSGLVLDLSASGLFIQTNAKARPGERFAISFAGPDGAPIAVQVEVVRTKVVPPNLLALTQGGFGVRILEAPPGYYEFLRWLGLEDAAPVRLRRAPASATTPRAASEPTAESGLRFRVHVSQTSGPRSRRIEVCAPDADAARDRALEEFGEGWKVLGVEAL